MRGDDAGLGFLDHPWRRETARRLGHKTLDYLAASTNIFRICPKKSYDRWMAIKPPPFR
jgi:hypothetical protein